jgi:hypothetical protein
MKFEYEKERERGEIKRIPGRDQGGCDQGWERDRRCRRD